MSKNTFGIGLATGALTGLVAAYFLAPKSGEEFREDAKVKGKEAKRKTLLAAGDALDSTENWLDEQIQNQKEKTREYAAATSKSYPVRDDYDYIKVDPETEEVIRNTNHL